MSLPPPHSGQNPEHDPGTKIETKTGTNIGTQPLGEILAAEFGLPPDRLEAGLAEQSAQAEQAERNGAPRPTERLGEILLRQGALTPETLAAALARQFGFACLPRIPEDCSAFFVPKVSIGLLKKYRMLPVATPERCFLALADPAFFRQAEDLARLLDWEGMPWAIAPEAAILRAINAAYDQTRPQEADQALQDMSEEDPAGVLSAIEEAADLLDDAGDAPVIRLVNLVLTQAAREGASDIHIEPCRDHVRIRKRIDGILHEMHSAPRQAQARIAARIKIMAGMDIAEKRLPQDGRIEIRIAQRALDIRVATLPTAFGERLTLRLLDKGDTLLPLTELGLSAADYRLFREFVAAPHGIILVTGPTGSGKTTTLYAALNTLNRPGINIITIEDPIEYRIDGISQMQVNARIGLSFAEGLRTIVRQDPDVILVGEIRDGETARIAIQSALTGHLVFSTLHTNDAVSSILRLEDLGLEPFLVASTMLGALAQRLVRRICVNCKEQYTADGEALAKMGFPVAGKDRVKLTRGRGCPQCRGTGYLGRMGIFEVFPMSAQIKKLIAARANDSELRQVAVREGMTTLKEDAWRKVRAGLTTVEEALRVTGEA